MVAILTIDLRINLGEEIPFQSRSKSIIEDSDWGDEGFSTLHNVGEDGHDCLYERESFEDD